MVSPLSTGAVIASLAVLVDDVDAHHTRVAATGAEIDYEPTDMPYGVREYSVRDPAGHLWSFHTPLIERQPCGQTWACGGAALQLPRFLDREV